MIYVCNVVSCEFDVECFNEVFMMYIIISLYYGVIVVCDVVLKMMEGVVGEFLV